MKKQRLDIPAALKQRNMTNRDLAQRLNVKDSSVTSFINGNPTVNTLYSIADVLGCQVTDLFTPIPSEESLSPSLAISCPHCHRPVFLSLIPSATLE